ncbi:MAG: aminoacyl-tRNA hydrolase [Propionibacteriaceae bacterium]
MWLVVGLGNPGPTYASHRHNVGFLVADELARRAGARFSAPKGVRAEVAEGRLGPLGPDSTRIVVVKPRTFMNESGQAVVKVAQFYKFAPEQVVAIHDELDIDPGQLRVKLGGGDNGHNGLRSIRQTLGTGDFYRVRFGIGRPPGRQDPASFVLTPFPAAMRADVEIEVGRAADAVESLISDGLERTQSRFNS